MVLLLAGCSRAYWDAKHTRMEQCRSLWQYVDLKDTLKVQILFFESHSTPHTGVNGCNFIIGTSEKFGKIGIADKSFSGSIKNGDIVEILPSNWNEEDKKYIHIIFNTYKNQKINDLHCSLYTIYYGKISKIIGENN